MSIIIIIEYRLLVKRLMSSSFGFEVAISITVPVLLANVALLTRMSFGKQIVTKLSERPYYISLTLVITIFFYLNTMCYLTNVTY